MLLMMTVPTPEQIATMDADQLRAMLRAPDVIVATWRAAKADIDGLTERDAEQAPELELGSVLHDTELGRPGEDVGRLDRRHG